MSKWLFYGSVVFAVASSLLLGWESIVNTSASGRPMKGKAGHYCPSCNELTTDLNAEVCPRCGRHFYPDGFRPSPSE